MRSIEIIIVVVLTVVLNSISVVHSQESGSGVAFEPPPGQSPIQAEELPMDLVEDYWGEDTEADQRFLEKDQKKQLDFNIVG